MQSENIPKSIILAGLLGGLNQLKPTAQAYPNSCSIFLPAAQRIDTAKIIETPLL